MADKKILVADDEAAILSLLYQLFTRAGFKVRTAESGMDAMKIIEKENLPVMIFDLNMPDMNGVELCRQIKEQQPMAVIYAITGYASLFELSECREAGFEDYFKKPVNVSTLLKTVESAFEKVGRWKKL